jgi:hypothetical protein
MINGASVAARFVGNCRQRERRGGVIYVFTICEHGGEEIEWCAVTCEEGLRRRL